MGKLIKRGSQWQNSNYVVYSIVEHPAVIFPRKNGHIAKQLVFPQTLLENMRFCRDDGWVVIT